MSPTTSSLRNAPSASKHANGRHRHSSADRRNGKNSIFNSKKGNGGLLTPTPVIQSSDGEDDLKSWCTGGDVTLSRRGQTEIEVIRDWFVNIFTPFEKTADLVVTDFKFEQMSHLRNSPPALTSSNSPSDDSSSKHFTVLKQATVNLSVQGKPKTYSVVIKVLPTDDNERYTTRSKFEQLLKFSKEVQVYMRVVQCMVIYDEKRYPSACVEPPVPRCYLGQLDAQNDVLVLENLAYSGYRKYSGGLHLTDVDHCRVVLRRLAFFHAFSTVIQRDSEQCVTGMFPFAVDATSFRDIFQNRVKVVKAELTKYLVSKVPRGYVSVVNSSPEDIKESDDKVEKHLQELFWRLVELRAPPDNEDPRFCVLAHGAVDLRNIMFQYDETTGRPICAKFLDFSTLTVSSPVIDITYFLHSSVVPELASHHHAALLQVYHRAHLEAIKSFGMHGYEMELEDLITEYQHKQDYGSMMACLLKPALYVLQSLNHSGPSEQHKRRVGGEKRNGAITNDGSSKDEVVDPIADFDVPSSSSDSSLKIDKNLVPVDLRLHGYLAALANLCPCPCAVGSRELTIAELSADSLEDLHSKAREQIHTGVKTFDCGGGGSKSTLKKFLLGLLHPSKDNDDIKFKHYKTNGISERKV